MSNFYANLKRTELWFKSLIAAFVQGFAVSLSAAIIAPDTFNLKNYDKFLELAIASGVMGAVMYLKQSPVPRFVEEDIAVPVSTSTGKPQQ